MFVRMRLCGINAGRMAVLMVCVMPGPWRVSVTVTPAGGGTPVTKTLDYNAQK